MGGLPGSALRRRGQRSRAWGVPPWLRISKKRYGFHAFTDAMFKAMGMEGPSRYIVEAACKFVRKSGPKNRLFRHQKRFETATYARMLLSFETFE